MSKYLPTIGLEIHAELKTATKMFCGCLNDADEKHPNINVCPICLGHPGVLPTINKKAIELMIQIGLAVGGEINKKFKFDRKNYFYPDLAKGYQISQYDMPIVKGGNIDISSRLGKQKNVKLNRVHLEEDAGKLAHSITNYQLPITNYSLVDFNRGGVPLMELVTEPDIHSAEEAAVFAKELQLILRYLGASDADLERGQMRFDLNISLTNNQQLTTNNRLGVKVEVKNLNSFAGLEGAIRYEIERQSGLLESGKEVKQETRGWDDVKKVTTSQRAKEEAHDYRYFPEPDLPILDSSGFDLQTLKLRIPELPEEKRVRFKKQFQLNGRQINILVENRNEAEFFEEAVSELEADDQQKINSQKIQLLFNYLNSDLKGLMSNQILSFDNLKITAGNFADLINMIYSGEISSRVAKDLLVKMVDSGVDPRTFVENEGLSQVSDENKLLEIVKKILNENSNAVNDYKKGKTNALQFLVGKAMAELKGRGNPAVLRNLFEKELK